MPGVTAVKSPMRTIASWLPSRVMTRPPLRGASASSAISKSMTPRMSSPRSLESPVCTSTARPPTHRFAPSIRPAARRMATKLSRLPWMSPMATTRGAAAASAAGGGSAGAVARMSPAGNAGVPARRGRRRRASQALSIPSSQSIKTRARARDVRGRAGARGLNASCGRGHGRRCGTSSRTRPRPGANAPRLPRGPRVPGGSVA